MGKHIAASSECGGGHRTASSGEGKGSTGLHYLGKGRGAQDCIIWGREGDRRTASSGEGKGSTRLHYLGKGRGAQDCIIWGRRGGGV